jgi:hypothetical protein
LSPLTALRLRQTLARSGEVLSDQPIDLRNESFVVYVPSTTPPSGFGLLVLVPPWEDARLPDGWASVLDQFGFIFVSAAHSGNNASDLGRREPLALVAEENIRKHERVDPARVFVAGFSGGARVAMRLALAYPDVFRGAVLDAGSDPIGTSEVPLPSRDLLHQFQISSQLVYIAGDADGPGQRANRLSMQSMRDWCMFNYVDQTTLFVGHVIADSGALARAIRALLEPPRADASALARCQSEIDGRLNGQLHDVESMIRNGKREEARDALARIDARFGGLAAPRIVELMEQ